MPWAADSRCPRQKRSTSLGSNKKPWAGLSLLRPRLKIACYVNSSAGRREATRLALASTDAELHGDGVGLVHLHYLPFRKSYCECILNIAQGALPVKLSYSFIYNVTEGV